MADKQHMILYKNWEHISIAGKDVFVMNMEGKKL